MTSPSAFLVIRQLLKIALLVSVIALVSACAATAPDSPSAGHGSDDLDVRLEPASAEVQQHSPLGHPLAASPAELQSVLASLRYVESGLLAGSSEQPVFAADELQDLVPALQSALAAATPGQQVRFASFTRRGGALGQQRKTEGVVFVDRADRLNLAFVDIHEFAGPDEDFFRFLELTDRDPLITRPSLIALHSDHPGHRSLTEQERQPLPLWIRADLTAVAAEPDRTEHPVAADEPVASEVQADPVASEPAPPAAAPAPPSSEVDRIELQVRQRLQFLKELHEDGLISTEEYEQQRREVLQRLD